MKVKEMNNIWISKVLRNKKILIPVLVVLGLIVGILIYLGVVAIIDCVENERGQFNGKLIGENLEQDDPVYGVQSYESYKLKKNLIVSTSYVSNGLLIYKEESNPKQYVFYSLHFNKELITISSKISFSVIVKDNFGYFIKVDYSSERVNLYDFYGNKIYDDSYDVENIKVQCDEKIAYVTLELEHGSKRFIKYWSNGTYQSIDEEDVNLSELEEDKKTKFNAGDLYIDLDRRDLSDFGLDGYYLSYNNGYGTVYNEDNQIVSTFNVPLTNNQKDVLGCVVGKYIVMQESHILPDDAKNYTCIAAGIKCYIETYTIDILTGKKTYVEVDYIFVNSSSLKNTKGKYVLGLANISRITSAKTLSNKVETVILNDKLEIIDEVNGVCSSIDDMVKMGDSYYNTKTKILYDEDLNVLAWLDAVSPILCAESEVFVVKNESKYGVINSKGKVVIPFEYDFISPSVYKNVTIGEKAGKFYLLNTLDGTATHVECDSLTYITNGVFMKENGVEFTFLKLDGTDCGSHNVLNQHNYYDFATTFGDSSYSFSMVKESGAYGYVYFYSFIKNPYKTA